MTLSLTPGLSMASPVELALMMHFSLWHIPRARPVFLQAPRTTRP